MTTRSKLPAVNTLAVALLCTLPFLQALGFGLCDYDDLYHLREQPFLGLPFGQAASAALLTPQYNFYSPVNAFLWLLDSRVHGVLGPVGGPVFSHALNLLIHLGTCLLLLRLGRILAPGARWAVLLGVLIFAWHPVRVEPVVWITARKDLLVGFFSLAAVVVAARAGEGAWSGRRHLLFWGLGVLALLSKPTAAFLPLLALAWPLFFPGAGGWRKLAVRFGPLALAAAAVVWINLAVKLAARDLLQPTGHDLFTRLVMPLHTLGHHLAGLLWPRGLSPIQDAEPPSLADPMPRLAVAALAGLAALLVRVRRGGGGASARVEAGLALAALVACLPVINLIPNTPFRRLVDSYVYAPSLFVSLLLGLLLARLGRRLRPALASAAMGALALTLGALSLAQARTWSDDEALYAHAIEVSPRSVRPYLGLSTLQMRVGKPGPALDTLIRGERVLPGDALLLNNMAVIFSAMDQWPRAASILEKLKPGTHPGLAYNLGVFALRAGRLEEGEALLRPLVRHQVLGGMARDALRAARDLLARGARPPLKDPALILRAIKG